MNCKQGDLAIIVRARNCPESLGAIVRCVRFCPHPLDGSPGWEIEPPFKTFRCARDSALRPLRDRPGEDEMLRIAGKPRKETVE